MGRKIIGDSKRKEPKGAAKKNSRRGRTCFMLTVSPNTNRLFKIQKTPNMFHFKLFSL